MTVGPRLLSREYWSHLAPTHTTPPRVSSHVVDAAFRGAPAGGVQAAVAALPWRRLRRARRPAPRQRRARRRGGGRFRAAPRAAAPGGPGGASAAAQGGPRRRRATQASRPRPAQAAALVPAAAARADDGAEVASSRMSYSRFLVRPAAQRQGRPSPLVAPPRAARARAPARPAARPRRRRRRRAARRGGRLAGRARPPATARPSLALASRPRFLPSPPRSLPNSRPPAGVPRHGPREEG